MKHEHYLGGRYSLDAPFARGGMATVHLGRTLGAAGFSRTVAIKRLHPQYASDKEFRSMFLDEARLVSRIHHPNVVPVLDVVEEPRGLYLVMEYVDGETLSSLGKLALARGERMPVDIAVRTMIDALRGLHAAHEARNERGEPLNIVHRDISPQNILVGSDGVTRVLDFGIAKAAERSTKTQDGQIKGKLAYLSPEQLTGGDVTRCSDVFAAGIVLWELLAGARLIEGKNDGERLKQILVGKPRSVRELRPEVPEALERIVLRALSRNPDERFAEAEQMAECLEDLQIAASPPEVAAWVEFTATEQLRQRQALLASTETSAPQAIADSGPPSAAAPPAPHSSGRPPLAHASARPSARPGRSPATLHGIAPLPPNPVPSDISPPPSRPPNSRPSGAHPPPTPEPPRAVALASPALPAPSTPLSQPPTQTAISLGAFESNAPPPSARAPLRVVAGGIGIGLLGTAFGIFLGVSFLAAPHAPASALAASAPTVCPPVPSAPAAAVPSPTTPAPAVSAPADPEPAASVVPGRPGQLRPVVKGPMPQPLSTRK